MRVCTEIDINFPFIPPKFYKWILRYREIWAPRRALFKERTSCMRREHERQRRDLFKENHGRSECSHKSCLELAPNSRMGYSVVRCSLSSPSLQSQISWLCVRGIVERGWIQYPRYISLWGHRSRWQGCVVKLFSLSPTIEVGRGRLPKRTRWLQQKPSEVTISNLERFRLP